MNRASLELKAKPNQNTKPGKCHPLDKTYKWVKRKTALLLLLVIGLQINLLAQDQIITVNGTMKDNDGQPLPGVNILIKGTSEGTVTDVNGNYSINAPLGSTLVISFIGMKTREAIVTLTGLNPVGTRIIIPYNTDPDASKLQSQLEKEKEQFEKAYIRRMERYNEYLKKQSTDSHYDYILQPLDTANDRQIKNLLKEYKSYTSKLYLSKIELNSYTTIYREGKLPQLQKTFAQGRSDGSNWQYRGPETGEIFSWGPKMNLLEYDGANNEYNLNGSIVNRGTGNGQTLQPFSSQDIFRSGYSSNNTISIYSSLWRAASVITYTNNTGKGVLPGMDNQSHTLKAKINLANFEGWINYHNENSQFQDKQLLARTLYSAFITPPSFDNRNGLSTRKASEEASAIYTPSGFIRSYAPGITDNPFYLLQTAKNPFTDRNLSGQISYKYQFLGNINGKIYAGGERFKNSQLLSFGNQTAQLPVGSFIRRTEKYSSFVAGGTIEYQPNWWGETEYNFSVPVFMSNSNHQIESTNSTSLFNEYYQPSLRRDFWSASPTITLNKYNLGLNFRTGMQFYQSSTASGSYLSPFVGIALQPLNVLDNLFYWNTKNALFAKLTFNISRNIKEYDLKYSYGSGNSLRYTVADFTSSLINEELGVSENIRPEKNTNLNAGLHLAFLHNRITSEFQLYRNKTTDAIYPRFVNDHQDLSNVADITVKGWEETLSFRFGNYHRGLSWSASITASAFVSNADRIYTSEAIPIAGFSDVYTALANNQPVGVIIGTRYQRNNTGQIVIGDDGFPLVDNRMQVVANPTPDMTLGFTNLFSLDGFSLGFTIHSQIGGKMWNGTRATLDYYGTSNQSGQERYIDDFIFSGVNQSGNSNNIPVAFAPKSQLTENNRWVRYGIAGVTEDYVEDASHLILKEIKFGYEFKRNLIKDLGLSQLNASVTFNNLVTISGYKGVMPTGSLWGHSNGKSLDYFNMPLVRSIGFYLNATF